MSDRRELNQTEWEKLQAIKFTRTKRLRSIFTTIAYIILTTWAIVSLLPMYWMFVCSFKHIGVSFSIDDIEFYPSNPTKENYINFLQLDAPPWIPRRPVARWFLNSLLVALLPTISNLIFDSMAGYAIAKMKFPLKQAIFWAIVMTMMIPEIVILIPLYRMMFDFKWYNTYWALLFPGFAGVGGIFLFKQSIESLPTSIIEAARVDAASEARIFFRIILPLSKPILSVMGIFGFIGGWNSYFWPYLVTESSKLYTIQVGLTSLMGAGGGAGVTGTLTFGIDEYGQMLAGASMAAIPVIIIFFLLQKYIIQGITIGALKG
jgi:multiple sugar transport system permease protein